MNEEQNMRRVLIAATHFSTGGDFEHPSRLVIFEWRSERGTPIEWSTHWQLKDGSTFAGDYHTHLPLAEFLDRMEKHNAQYTPGSASHLPGVDFVDTRGHGEIQVEDPLRRR